MVSGLVYISQFCNSRDGGPAGLLGCYLGVCLGVICDMGSRKTLLDSMVVEVEVLEGDHLNFSF